MSRQSGRRRSRTSGRRLATVLFTDIVGSTEQAVEVGDRRWRQVLAAHHALVRKQLKRFGGREIDTAGDGFFATFDEPARAVDCAAAILEGLPRIGIHARAGVHMGEVEVSGAEVRGVAVHIGARIMSLAGPGEVLVSSTVRDLMAGSDVRFEDRGLRELKGVPAQWRLFAVEPPLPDETPEEPLALSPEPEPKRPGRLRPAWIISAAAVTLAAVIGGAALLTGGDGGQQPRKTAPAAVVPDNAVLQIDPGSGKVRTTVKGLVAGSALFPARHIEIGEGGVWVDTAITLQHIDPKTGKLVGQIQAQHLVATIAVGQGAIWAGGNVGITRISPATDEVEHTIFYDTGFARPIDIAVEGGDVWMLVSDGRLLRIDAGTNRIKKERKVGSGGNDLAVSSGSLWILDQLDERVIEVDSRTGRIRRRIHVAGNLERVVVSGGTIWVMDEDAGVVTPIDPTSGVPQAPIRVGESPVDMAVGLGAVWVANRGDGTITRIDPVSHTRRTLQVGGSIAAIATDPDRKTLWVYLTQPDPTALGH